MVEPLTSDATSIAASVRRRAASARQMVDAALARAYRVDPRLNPFCEVFQDDALREAALIDQRVAAGESLPLAGVPVAIKDFTPVAGHRTTFGSLAFRDHVSVWDAPVVSRLREAGAIILGKTTTSEFATSSFTETPLFGITRNPWNPERTAGGSSGGSAVAVATGCVPLAEGSDAGGSVRIPAALCGCVGFKPSFGRVPFGIIGSGFEFIWHHGSLSRSVRDAALFLESTSGQDDRDIWSYYPPYRQDSTLTQGVRGMRLALSVDLGIFDVSADVLSLTRAAAALLRSAGAIVEEIALPWSADIVDAFITDLAALTACLYGAVADVLGTDATTVFRELVRRGRTASAIDLKHANIVRTRQWQSLATVLRDHDVLLCPTTCRTAPPVGGSDFDYGELNDSGRIQGLDMTFPFNNLGPCPALSVPCGRGVDGLPVALQIVGAPYTDAQVLRVGMAFEEAFAPGVGLPNLHTLDEPGVITYT